MLCLATILVASAVSVAVACWLNDYWRRQFVPDFSKKAVVVTGSDSGFGRAIAVDLAARGLTVFAGCYTDKGADSLREDAGRLDIRVVKLDVTSDQSVRALRETVERELQKGQGGLWGIVNNAGIPGGYMQEWADIDEFKRVMDVNFFGQVRMDLEFLPLLKESRGGRIVNMASILGRITLLSPYAASKAAVQAHNDGLRRQVEADGIKVSSIEPGAFRTDIVTQETTGRYLDAQWNSLSERRRQELGGEDFKNKLLEDFVATLNNLPMAGSNKVSEVVDAVRHALGSVRPKKRYVCGRDARFLYRPIAVLLPDWAVDRAVKIIFHK